MTDTSDKRLNEVLADAAKATPGPWRAMQTIGEAFYGDGHRRTRRLNFGFIKKIAVYPHEIPKDAVPGECQIKGFDNATHIANCDPEFITALINRVRSQDEELQRLRAKENG